MNPVVPIGLAAAFSGLVVGAAVAVWAFPREVKVEVPVEVVRTVEKRVPVAPAAPAITEEQARQLEQAAAIQRACSVASVAFSEGAVMPLNNNVKVIVALPDLFNQKYPREAIKAKVVEALREEGINVLADEAPADAFNTTIMVTVDTFVQAGTKFHVGHAGVSILQTGVFGTAGEWRMINVPVHQEGTIFSFDDASLTRLDTYFDTTVRKFAEVLRKADSASRARQGR